MKAPCTTCNGTGIHPRAAEPSIAYPGMNAYIAAMYPCTECDGRGERTLEYRAQQELKALQALQDDLQADAVCSHCHGASFDPDKLPLERMCPVCDGGRRIS